MYRCSSETSTHSAEGGQRLQLQELCLPDRVTGFTSSVSKSTLFAAAERKTQPESKIRGNAMRISTS
jgi:hypothetical protein